MKRKQRELDIFNLSFLDIISCGFGAVVMLVLISKTGDDIAVAGKEQITDLLGNLLNLENSISNIQQSIDNQQAEAEKLDSRNANLAQIAQGLEDEIRKQQRAQEEMQSSLEGLSLVESTLKQASTPTRKTQSTERDEEVGGIPVDSDYVVFIVDTSGSMQQIWPRVSAQVINVLNIHPQVKGFQILNDMGKSIISGYEGKWIPDTEGRRNSVIRRFSSWSDYSNSSPVEGIETALRRYAKPNISTSIYVFGDDYTGASYDSIIETISKSNQSKISGKQLARIHGVGFRSRGTTNRFGILMRELTRRNNGTYLALP